MASSVGVLKRRVWCNPTIDKICDRTEPNYHKEPEVGAATEEWFSISPPKDRGYEQVQ